ncbi:GAF and ANTAR domain-containing protein [Agromyces laixinhei]|uniref:GAF and ANTAR domain-containing protein n=1 Tax=Agromyces laixinhei TaxID=2585717 RepID=UPI001116C0E7|nr:GAF and ANTAR domain-containing protein [Agromyces laixinhei]
MSDDGTEARTEPGDAPAAAAALCARFIELLPVQGVSISVVGAPAHSTIGASDTVAARAEELQFELGEGPHWEALRGGQAVLVPDLDERDQSWPVFGAAVRELGVGALFAFPMFMGAVTVGVVDMYRSTPGGLDARAIATARTLAASTAGAALRLAARSASEDSVARGALTPEMRREVHQATGMILAQLQVTATEAFSRLQAHAYSTGQTVEFVAHEVVARRLSFRN